MSAASKLQQVGQNALHRFSGETLTYVDKANASVVATVNRNVVKGKDFFAQLRDVPVDFDTLGLAEIEIRKSVIPDWTPEAGHRFIDESGYRFRVRYVVQTDITWLLFSTPSKVV